MKYIATYKVFESRQYKWPKKHYEFVRKSNSGLEQTFKIMDQWVDRLNSYYDNVEILHRGNKFYDIYYKLSYPMIINGKINIEWIHIGVYDIDQLEFHLWEAKSISEYRGQGSPDNEQDHTFKSGLNDLSFEKFLNMWYDIYDKL